MHNQFSIFIGLWLGDSFGWSIGQVINQWEPNKNHEFVGQTEH